MLATAVAVVTCHGTVRACNLLQLSAVCAHVPFCHAADLLDSVRSQLDIDEVRATEVQRLLGLVASAMRQQAGGRDRHTTAHKGSTDDSAALSSKRRRGKHLRKAVQGISLPCGCDFWEEKKVKACVLCAGPLAVSKSWTANLELPLSMLGVVLPRDFSRCGQHVCRALPQPPDPKATPCCVAVRLMQSSTWRVLGV